MSTKTITCPKCNGKGTDYSIFNGWTKCKTCNGTGKVKVKG
jgi:DnaJ-class molecular chaperone